MIRPQSAIYEWRGAPYISIYRQTDSISSLSFIDPITKEVLLTRDYKSKGKAIEELKILRYTIGLIIDDEKD